MRPPMASHPPHLSEQHFSQSRRFHSPTDAEQGNGSFVGSTRSATPSSKEGSQAGTHVGSSRYAESYADEESEDEEDPFYEEYNPPCGKRLIVLLNLIFVALACVASILVTRNEYNTEASNDWILAGGITDSSVTFK